MSHQNGGDNLYTRIHRLLVTEQYAEAEQVLEEYLSRDPSSREAILSWTELKLVQGQTDTVIERLGPLTIRFPTDPYYMLAAAEHLCRKAGTTLANVVRVQQFHTDVDDFGEAWQVWDRYLPNQHLPFSAIEVPALGVPGAVVMLDLWVYVP